MNKTAMHVFRLYVMAHNLKRIPRSMTWTCYSHTASLSYSSNSNSNTKDYRYALRPASQSEESDVITQFISAAKTSDNIFHIVKEYRPFLTIQHSLQALEMLNNMYRKKNITDTSIRNKIEFIQLCEVLASDIRSLDANVAVKILKVISHLGVPSSSIITQSLLQLIRSSLSYLSFYNLVDLDYQLNNFVSTPLTDALKIAIPLMCELQLNNKMVDTFDVSQLCSALLYVSSRPGHKESTEMIIDALRRIGPPMVVSQAKHILRSLCESEYLPTGYEEVLLNVQKVLTINMTRLQYHDIQLLLGKVVKKVAHHGNKTFYNEEFIDAFSKAVISEDYGFEEGVKILSYLWRLGHTQIRLIDYLAAKCFENPQLLKNSTQHTVISLIIALASADYKPIFWESMQEIILKSLPNYDCKRKPILIDFAISMAVLDCFDPELIKITFNEQFPHPRLSQNHRHIYWKLLLLYQSVKLLCPTYNGPWPPEHMITAAINSNGVSLEKSSLLPTLEKAMGGSQYILSNLKSKLGHHIDHVVVMRKGGYPVAINSLQEVPDEEPVTYIEDLQLPAESQVIIVINLPANAYSINSLRLQGYWTLLLKTLEIQTKHTVIPISSTMWNALMDHEKIPYLMQAIRLKCDSLSASANIR